MSDIFAVMTGASLYNHADNNMDNMMEANPGKFQAIVLRDSNESTTFNIGGSKIESERQTKQLGVEIDGNLNFHQQVRALCRKAGAGAELRVLQHLALAS